MKTNSLVLLAMLSAPLLASAGEIPAPGGAPHLAFRTVPIDGASSAGRSVKPYRLHDKIIVTVREPVACGQKAVEPDFSLKGDTLSVSYVLTPAAADVKRCTLVSEFAVLNAPHRDLKVRFATGAEPYTVAALQKCPFYTPTSRDRWECLSPANP
jgi:hypothetical protein